MTTSVRQHQIEIERNWAAWKKKPLLLEVYSDFYRRIIQSVHLRPPGRILEIGSGIGALKSHLPDAILLDISVNPWLDVVGDAYRLPFADGSVSYVIVLDVFHHLSAPRAFLNETRRVLMRRGRLIICEPFISWVSAAAYGIFHHEPIGWTRRIDDTGVAPPKADYYAAQGNATRIFFCGEDLSYFAGWSIVDKTAFASMSYLLSGGFSKPALYPARWLPALRRLDRWLSRFPTWFGARCLVTLQKNPAG